MAIIAKSSEFLSEFLQYLAARTATGEERLPALSELSRELGVSVASLREQLEVARTLGLVEVRPRTGIRWLPYRFAPSMFASVAYAITISPNYFEEYRDFRNHLEASYFIEAVMLLERTDVERLMEIVERAEKKIEASPPQLPHYEHCQLHQMLFSRIKNTYVQGVFEVYWDVYEAIGFSIISDLDYLRRVWTYHRKIVESIREGNLTDAYQAFLEHKELLVRNPKPIPSQAFE